MACLSYQSHFAPVETSVYKYNNRDIVSTTDDNDYSSILLGEPQFCVALASDIYCNLRASQGKHRPATNYMEKVQKDLTASMRATLVDWLVEVAEKFRLVPDTLYLAVNYMDRYLSGNVMDTHELELLCVACIMIASKYEENRVHAPRVEELRKFTDNAYLKEEVLQMESHVLNYLKFEMSAPTTKSFLRLFVCAAVLVGSEAPLLQLELLSDYIAELSLLEYNMLCFAPSLLAASSLFLAKFILLPSKRPWNASLLYYTHYHSSDLQECVMALHNLCCNSQSSTLPAIRKKYSQEMYASVAKKYCPPSIPQSFFQN